MALFDLSQIKERLFGAPELGTEQSATLLDPLTRLPTRVSVVRELKHCLAKSHGRRPVALAIIDFSNAQGMVEEGAVVDPDLLIRLSRMLTSHVPDHFVGHLRDREFAVIMCDKQIAEVENLANEMINAVRNDETLSERRYIATIVGIGYSSQGDCRAPQLMGLADIALHYALATGRGCHVIVDRVPAPRAA